MNNDDFEYRLFFPDPAPIVRFVKWLTTAYYQEDGISLLDVGCGFGRTLPGFCELGWRVVGIEPDLDFYLQAKEFEKTTSSLSVKQNGFLGINDSELFDVIISINDPFAYLDKISDRIEALRRVYNALKKGGIFVIDVPNFLYVLANIKDLRKRTCSTDYYTYHRTTYQQLDFHESIWTNIDVYERVDKLGNVAQQTKIQNLAILSFREIQYFLEQQGFIDIRTYNSFDTRCNEKLFGKRIIIAAQKPV